MSRGLGDVYKRQAQDACEGLWNKVRAAGGGLEFSLPDLSTQTVRATLAEITAATFDVDERSDLKTLLKVSPDANPSLPNRVIGLNTRNALFAVMVAFRGEIPPIQQRTVILAPDPAPPGDLSSWRALAHLPLDFPPFPALPPEKPIQ